MNEDPKLQQLALGPLSMGRRTWPCVKVGCIGPFDRCRARGCPRAQLTKDPEQLMTGTLGEKPWGGNAPHW